MSTSVPACGATPAAPADAGLDAARRGDAGLVDATTGQDTALDAAETGTIDAGGEDPFAIGPAYGARRHADGEIEVRLRAPGATHVEICFFAMPSGEGERLRLPLDAGAADTFSLRVPAAMLRSAGVGATVYYGYRVWGPNWTYDARWAPGSDLGLVTDVDASGYRMNPNKLLLDPYALEVSHDPFAPVHADGRDYGGGAQRLVDTAPFAPKGIVIDVAPPTSAHPARAMRDEIVYEVQVRGLTMADTTLGDAAGTYEGAAMRAARLHALGVTAIELLPLHETPNDQNDTTADASGDNYWGYSTLSYFAPDRHYAHDRSAGGPTRELRAMIDAFHAEGIEVWVDVVYNHTAEGNDALLSFRGVSNPTYYEIDAAGTGYVNGNGVGPNVATANAVAADMVLDSLHYWHDVLGADGFRFDLAPIVGNGCARDCYRFDTALPARIARELPARTSDGTRGAALVAEPWGLANGSYQLGGFPSGWSEWNDRFRDTVRRDLNRLDVETVTVRELAHRIEGSVDIMGARGPSASINFVDAHDGFTLRDLFTYDTKQNMQAWPWGPSGGGSDNNLSWSCGGDPARQRLGARTALGLAMLSAGVPMFVGGDEFLRTQRGNNNPYNLDSSGTWLDPMGAASEPAFFAYASALIAFRQAHAALRPASAWMAAGDLDHDGLMQVRWLDDAGHAASDAYFDANNRHFLAWELDGDELGDTSPAIFVAYNGWNGTIDATVPAAPAGTAWVLAIDTSIAAEAWSNAHDDAHASPVTTPTIGVAGRSLVVLVAR